jgi:hypothetical protein
MNIPVQRLSLGNKKYNLKKSEPIHNAVKGEGLISCDVITNSSEQSS